MIYLLQKSGMPSVVRRMVHKIVNDQEDITGINPEDILDQVYKRGLMKEFMESIEGRDMLGQRRKLAAASPEQDEVLSLHPGLIIDDIHDSSDDDKISNELRKSGKYVLKVKLEGGRCFLDHVLGTKAPKSPKSSLISSLLHPSHNGKDFSQNNGYLLTDSSSRLTLHIFYKSQRFSTTSVLSRCDPDFKETFLIEIGRFKDVSSPVVELLNVNEPLRMIVVREDVNRLGGIPVAFCQYDWRPILIKENGFKIVSLELMGIGPEHSVCVGILRVVFTLVPLPQERISEERYLDKANEDSAKDNNRQRVWLTLAKRWWKEFTEIRVDHQFRLVRMMSYDENMVARPVTRCIKHVDHDELLSTPFEAAWFVALLPMTESNHVSLDWSGKEGTKKDLPGIQNGIGGCALSELWQSAETTIASKAGTVEDHAVLLTSIFLGFGLDAYVALGTKKDKGSWAWTITLSENYKPTFWESTTGDYYEHYSYPEESDRVDAKLLTKLAKTNIFGFCTISCIFNSNRFYANVQPTTSVDYVDWDLENPSKWKYLSYFDNDPYNSVSEYPMRLQGATLNVELLSKKLDYQLKNLLLATRKEHGKTTQWNSQLSQFMAQHLHREELEVSTGGSHFIDYFQTVALKTLPSGHEFRAHTFHSRSSEAHLLFSKALREPIASEIIFPQGDRVHHALKVKVFPYPEDVISVRCMIACTYIPV